MAWPNWYYLLLDMPWYGGLRDDSEIFIPPAWASMRKVGCLDVLPR